MIFDEKQQGDFFGVFWAVFVELQLMLLSFLVFPNVFGPPTTVAAVVDFKNWDRGW
jgi:hypothetical protein